MPVDEQVRELVRDAFHVGPASNANVAIAEGRRSRAASGEDEGRPSCRSYEMILSGWRVFVDEQLPKLVYHLESVGAHLPACRGVIVSAFVGDELHLVDARDFVSRAMRLLSVSPAQLVERYGTGERRTAAREPVLLPPPKGRN